MLRTAHDRVPSSEPVVALVGPTASGKTDLALELAERARRGDRQLRLAAGLPRASTSAPPSPPPRSAPRCRITASTWSIPTRLRLRPLSRAGASTPGGHSGARPRRRRGRRHGLYLKVLRSALRGGAAAPTVRCALAGRREGARRRGCLHARSRVHRSRRRRAPARRATCAAGPRARGGGLTGAPAQRMAGGPRFRARRATRCRLLGLAVRARRARCAHHGARQAV